MEERLQLSILLPEDLTKVFLEAVEERVKETDLERNHKSEIVREALYKHFNMEQPTKARKTKKTVEIKIHRKIGIEDVAHVLEKGKLYDFPILKEITGLSRTTLRRLILDNPDWFEEHKKGANGKNQYLMIKEVLKPNKKTEKRKGNRRKAKAKSKEAKGIVEETKIFTKKRDGELVEFIKEPGKRTRRLGRPDDETYMDVRILCSQRKITEDEMLIYELMNYEEKPSLWTDHMKFSQEEIQELLPTRPVVIEQINKLLKS